MANFTGPRTNQIRTSNQQPDLAQWMRDVDKRTGHFGGRVATRLDLSSLIPFEDLQVFIDDEKKYVVFKNGVWEDILGGGGSGSGGGGTGGTVDPLLEGRVSNLEMQVSNISKDYTEDFVTQNRVDLAQTTAVVEPGRIRAQKLPSFTDPLDDSSHVDSFGTTDIVVANGYAKLAHSRLEGYLVSNALSVNNATELKVDALITQHTGMGFQEGVEEVLNKVSLLELITETLIAEDNTGRQWRVMITPKKVYVQCINAVGAIVVDTTIIPPTTAAMRPTVYTSPCIVVDHDNKVWISYTTLLNSVSTSYISILNPDGSPYIPTFIARSMQSSAQYIEGSSLMLAPNRRVLFISPQNTTSGTGGLTLFIYELDGTTYKSVLLYSATSMSVKDSQIVYDKINNKLIWLATHSTLFAYGAIDLDGNILTPSKTIASQSPVSLEAFYNEIFGVVRVYALNNGAIRVFDIDCVTVTATLLGILPITEAPLPHPMSGLKDGNQYSLAYTSAIGGAAASIVYYVKLGHQWDEIVIPPTPVTSVNGYNAYFPSLFYNRHKQQIEVYASNTSVDPTYRTVNKYTYKTEQTKVEVDVSSDNGLSWLPTKLGDYVKFNSPTNIVRVRFKLMSPVTSNWISPEISQYQITDIANSLEEKVAMFVSSKLPSLGTVANVVVTAQQKLNNGTVQWFASNDGGANWYPVGLGQRYTFPNRLNGDLRIKIVITSPVGEPTSPIVSGYTVLTGNTVTGVDLQEIEANIAKTNFRFAALLNISRYNLKNMFIDTFADSSGIDSVKTSGVDIVNGSLTLANAGVPLVPKLSDSVSNPPIVVTESSYSSTSFQAWRLFDNTPTYWQSKTGTVAVDSPEWVQIDFGVGNNKKINLYALTMAVSKESYPKDFQLQGSHNGIEWTIVDIQRGVIWIEGEKKTFTVGTPGFYRYYRLLVQEVSGPSTIAVRISEMELFTTDNGSGTGIIYSAAEDVITVPSKAFLIVDESLNAGTITYEVSRDNGVSWKPIEKEKLTDVSDQPNGTKLVLRATITDNAMLHSWALSWN